MKSLIAASSSTVKTLTVTPPNWLAHVRQFRSDSHVRHQVNNVVLGISEVIIIRRLELGFIFQIRRPFEMAKAVPLVHPNATLQVPARLLVTKCDLFLNEPGLAALAYDVKSPVSVSDFREFVSTLSGTTVKVTNDNFRGFVAALRRVSFPRFGWRLSQFREFGDYTEDGLLLSALKKCILAMEEQMHHSKREIALLRRELSWLQELFEERLRTEAESVSGRANEVEKSVAEVQSEAATLREVWRSAKKE
jgi:hypothetical protein